MSRLQGRQAKSDCPGCIALKRDDWAARWPVGACSDDCLILTEKQRRARKAKKLTQATGIPA